MIKVQSLAYTSSQYANELMVDYYGGKEALKPFYKYNPNIEGLLQAAKERDFSQSSRQIIHDAIESQILDLNIKKTSLQDQNLQLLLDKNTFTVTTGHQLCLFTGPLYTIYKIASTIKLAKELNEASKDKKFIPIYWLASEDHDFEEINHVNVYGKTLTWTQPFGDAVGRMPLNQLTDTIEAYLQILGEGNFSSEAKDLFAQAYADEKNLGQATYILINALFKDHGLLILDGDESNLKAQAKEIFGQELKNNVYQETVNATSEKLMAIGYKKQVNPREINLFYLHEGKRIRIVKDGDRFQLDDSDQRYALNEVMQLLENHPERFSPNVIMRPLYQEAILPNIAYFGGAGELTYWFQLKEGFEKFNMPFPVLLLRNSALIVDPNSQKKLDKLGLSATQLYGDFEELLKTVVKDSATEELTLTKEKAEVLAAFEKVITRGEAIDKSVVQFAQGEKRKAEKAIDVIEKKFLQAEKRKHEVSLNQLRKVKENLFPGGSLQERKNNYFQYFTTEGNKIVTDLIDSFEPLETDVLIYNYSKHN